jgi:membrane protein involved in colicin uptake
MQSGVGGGSNSGTPEDVSRRGSKDSDDSTATRDPADASSGLGRALRGAAPEVRDFVLRSLERNERKADAADERAREAEVRAREAEVRAREAEVRTRVAEVRAREAEERAKKAEERAERLAAQRRCCVVA